MTQWIIARGSKDEEVVEKLGQRNSVVGRYSWKVQCKTDLRALQIVSKFFGGPMQDAVPTVCYILRGKQARVVKTSLQFKSNILI